MPFGETQDTSNISHGVGRDIPSTGFGFECSIAYSTPMVNVPNQLFFLFGHPYSNIEWSVLDVRMEINRHVLGRD